MGRPLHPYPAKLFTSLIWQDTKACEQALKILERSFGPSDFRSPVFPFDITGYYAAETGTPLKRVFISFRTLIRAEALTAAKIKTNAIERRLTAHDRRRINIDPGYISMGKLVLATTKNHAHRIYAGKGIFHEATLVFRGRSYMPCAHTYPDYRKEMHIDLFNMIRDLYARQITSAYGRAALSKCP